MYLDCLCISILDTYVTEWIRQIALSRTNTCIRDTLSSIRGIIVAISRYWFRLFRAKLPTNLRENKKNDNGGKKGHWGKKHEGFTRPEREKDRTFRTMLMS